MNLQTLAAVAVCLNLPAQEEKKCDSNEAACVSIFTVITSAYLIQQFADKMRAILSFKSKILELRTSSSAEFQSIILMFGILLSFPVSSFLNLHY